MGNVVRKSHGPAEEKWSSAPTPGRPYDWSIVTASFNTYDNH